MKDKIGEIAGNIWQTLGKNGEINVSDLPRMLNQKSDVVYQGLGWLAREDKISYLTKGAKTYVGLTAQEKEIFKNSLLTC
jgi:Mn-dependent DtxR family transcriptional regulator